MAVKGLAVGEEAVERSEQGQIDLGLAYTEYSSSVNIISITKT